MAQAQAQLSNARATYERTKNLFAQKFVSQSALDQAEAGYRAAEAQMKAASANRGQATTGRSFTVIQSPLTGVVAERLTELGEMAAPGKPLLTIYDPKGMRVVASIPQYKLAELRGNVRAKVEFPDTGKWVDATEVELLPVADARTHVVRARVQLPDNLPGVVPGMFARAHFVIGQAKKLVMPQRAVVKRGELTGVYVLDDSGVPQLRQVRTGESFAGGLIEVLAGLAAGEKVSLEPVKAGITLKQARARVGHPASGNRQAQFECEPPRPQMGISGRIAAHFQRNSLTPLIALIALLLGLFAILVTPREEEPQINVTMANVFIPFPGASAKDVESLVARPAEQVLSRICRHRARVFGVAPRHGGDHRAVRGRRGPDPGAGAALRHHQLAPATGCRPTSASASRSSSRRASTTCPSSR